MKKIILSSILFLIICSLFISGCGKQSEQDKIAETTFKCMKDCLTFPSATMINQCLDGCDYKSELNDYNFIQGLNSENRDTMSCIELGGVYLSHNPPKYPEEIRGAYSNCF